METDSLTTELTPLYSLPAQTRESRPDYLVSLWGVCFRQRLQNFWNSSRPVVVFLFFVVE